MFTMPPVPATFEQRGGWLINRLMQSFSLTQNQAAGIVGNLGFESNGFKTLQEISPVAGRGGFGWAQWTGPRRRLFEAYASLHNLSPSSDEANVGYLEEELSKAYAHTIQQLKKTTTLEAAVFTFGVLFEAPGGTTETYLPGNAGRLHWANVALKGVNVATEPPIVKPSPTPIPVSIKLSWWQRLLQVFR